MKKLISDKELVAYISGQLTTEQTRQLHAKAIANGESDLLLHVQLAALECDSQLADELLGKDDFADGIGTHQNAMPIAAKDLE